jgi:phosphatidylglycerol lysyltransferase
VYLASREFATAEVLCHLNSLSPENIMAALSNLLTRPGRTLTAFTGSLISSSVELGERQLNLGLAPGSVTHEHILQALRIGGYNSTSYLALEPDKRHFVHSTTAAVTAYALFNRVAIAAGEPICSPAELPAAIDEFLTFNRQNRWRSLFFEVTEPVVPHLKERGFQFLKLGEEPFFDLERFTLKGNKMANVRSSGNTARNRGVTVREYSPLSREAVSINPQLEAISRQWLAGRGVGELSFTLGSLSLSHPGDRRYFVAEREGQVIGFLTYTPIYARDGVYLDLMRRASETPPGTMDLLLTESFRLLKEAGVKWATMGMSPLANVENSAIEQNDRFAWLLHQIYQRGQAVYNFKQLHDFKQKFQPHCWESKYLAYQKLSFPELDAIIQAVQGQSIGQIVWALMNQPLF